MLELFEPAIRACRAGGLYMEFGVACGASLRKIRQLLPVNIPLYGFDSFLGLPEPWREFGVGTFATAHRIALANTALIEGWFDVTLPGFIATHPGHVSFMHIDCDLYSSTRTVLEAFAERIVPGTVILFDELFGYDGWEDHEYKAWSEFVAGHDVQFEAIGRWNAFCAAVRIVEIR